MLKELSNMHIPGAQGRGQPQPLGAFCEAWTYPERYWGADVFDVLTVTKSGRVFGMMRTPDPNDETCDTSEDAYDGYAMWPVGLKLARCAV